MSAERTGCLSIWSALGYDEAMATFYDQHSVQSASDDVPSGFGWYIYCNEEGMTPG